MKKYNVKRVKQITGLNDQEFFEIKKKMIKDESVKEYSKEEVDLFALAKLYIELGETPLNIINKFKSMNNDTKSILQDIHLLASKNIKNSIEVISIIEVINSIGIGYNDKSIFEFVDLKKVIKYMQKANMKLMSILNEKMTEGLNESLKEKLLDSLSDNVDEWIVDAEKFGKIDEYKEIESKINNIYENILNNDVDPYRMLLLDKLNDYRNELEGTSIKDIISKYFKQFIDEIQKALMHYASEEKNADLIVLIASMHLGKANIDEMDIYNWKDCAPNLIKIIGKYYPIFKDQDALSVLDGIINGIINIGNYEEDYIYKSKIVKEIIKYYLNLERYIK